MRFITSRCVLARQESFVSQRDPSLLRNSPRRRCSRKLGFLEILFFHRAPCSVGEFAAMFAMFSVPTCAPGFKMATSSGLVWGGESLRYCCVTRCGYGINEGHYPESPAMISLRC